MAVRWHRKEPSAPLPANCPRFRAQLFLERKPEGCAVLQARDEWDSRDLFLDQSEPSVPPFYSPLVLLISPGCALLEWWSLFKAKAYCRDFFPGDLERHDQTSALSKPRPAFEHPAKNAFFECREARAATGSRSGYVYHLVQGDASCFN